SFYFARNYDRAIELYRKTIELDRNFIQAHIWLGEAYVQKALYPEAVAELQDAVALSGENHSVLAALGHAYAVSGKRAEALQTLNRLRELSKQTYVSPFGVASIYAGLGQKDQTFEWLEKAYAERHSYLIFLKVEPIWDSLRSDPRFTDLLRRMRLVL